MEELRRRASDAGMSTSQVSPQAKEAQERASYARAWLRDPLIKAIPLQSCVDSFLDVIGTDTLEIPDVARTMLLLLRSQDPRLENNRLKKRVRDLALRSGSWSGSFSGGLASILRAEWNRPAFTSRWKPDILHVLTRSGWSGRAWVALRTLRGVTSVNDAWRMSWWQAVVMAAPGVPEHMREASSVWLVEATPVRLGREYWYQVLENPWLLSLGFVREAFARLHEYTDVRFMILLASAGSAVDPALGESLAVNWIRNLESPIQWDVAIQYLATLEARPFLSEAVVGELMARATGNMWTRVWAELLPLASGSSAE